MTTPFGVFTLDDPMALLAALVLLPLALLLLRSRRRLSRSRTVLVALARTTVVMLLVLALAGLTRRIPVDTLAVVFVVDRSASVGSDGLREARDFVTEALGSQGRDDLAGVVVFGADAQVQSEPRPDLRWEGFDADVSPHHSDLAAGLRLGTALLPSDRARRVVLISDGEETRGDAAAQVWLTAGNDLEVAVMPIGGRRGPEVVLEDMLMPARVDEGAPFEVRVVARADQPTRGTLRLYRNDQYLGERPVELGAGRAELLSVRQEASSPGLYRYRATLEVDDPAADTLPQNNVAVSTVRVTGRPRVLLVEGYTGQERYLAGVLRAQGVGVDVVPPADVPPGLAELRPYAAVFLSDTPAYALTNRQMEAMEAYVRDLGRGLVMIGGDQSFGVGGYYDTPVENALPVRMDLQDKTRFPKLGMVLAIDKSCSMGGGAGSKLAMAREAGIRTVELLSERDSLGVIGFDSAASWIVRLRPLADKGPVRDQIGSIRVGGGTDIYPAVAEGVRALNTSDAALKHVIILSDGITAGGDFQKLLTGANKEGVTVSTLAFGADADLYTMQQFAAWGGGRYYMVSDPKQLPAIFTRETLLATRSFLVEETFRPVPGAHSDVLKGMGLSDLPLLHGYVATEAKPRAIVGLTTGGEHDSPLLAHWQYGLGRSLAFTSDAKARWARDWINTPEYTRFWSQVLRWSVGQADGDDLQIEAEIRGGELVITVDAFDEQGGYLNFLDGEARIVAPDLTVHPVPMVQVAPGRYEASLAVDQDGSWLAGVAMRQGEVVVGQGVVEAVQAYSPEYRISRMGPALLADLGAIGGGGTLTDAAEVFRRPNVPRQIPQPLWPHLLWLAALALLVDVALRRIAIGRRPRVAVADAVLRAAASARAPRRRAVARVRRDAPVAVQDDLPDEPAAVPPVEVEEGSYAGRLLAARKTARKKMGDDDP